MVEVRRALEAEVATLAAQRRTQDDIKRIRQSIAALDKAVKAGGDGAEEDVNYHRAIAVAARNPFLNSTLDYLRQFLHGAERHEPDMGELSYPYLFSVIDELQYPGWIGCEYRPRQGGVSGRTSTGLGWLKPWLWLPAQNQGAAAGLQAAAGARSFTPLMRNMNTPRDLPDTAGSSTRGSSS